MSHGSLTLFLDLNFTKLLVLGVVALIVFGPDRLPAMASQAGRALRELRRMADGAKSELQENLGSEFSDFDIADLNPRHFVRKHFLDELTGANGALTSWPDGSPRGADGPAGVPAADRLRPGERPPFDVDAT